MSAAELDELLDRMPQIAAAVEMFNAESLQVEAFRTLVAAYSGTTTLDATADAGPTETDAGTLSAGAAGAGANEKPAKKGSAKKASAKKVSGSKLKQSFSIDKALDLVKGGTPSFKDFFEAKKPTSALEKCLVAVYWLTRHRTSAAPATVEQVYTCFKSAGWQVPADLVNTLQQAGTRGWLDTKKRDDLKVVVAGENHVEHEMPASVPTK